MSPEVCTQGQRNKRESPLEELKLCTMNVLHDCGAWGSEKGAVVVHARFASCGAPQEMSVVGIGKVLPEKRFHCHGPSSGGPRLDVRGSDAFEAGLILFWEDLDGRSKAEEFRLMRVQW